MEMSNQEFFALDNEIRTSLKLIELGFGEIQSLSMENDFIHLPLQLLASGIERLLKCILLINHYNENESFPSKSYLFDDKNNGHNLVYLKDKVLREAFSADVPATKNDKAFIANNPILVELLVILTEFGKYSRYHSINILLGEEHRSTDVEVKWDELKMKIYSENDDLFKQLVDTEKADSTIQESNNVIIKHLEIFTRGLVRQFTLGKFSNFGRRFSGYFSQFLFLKDDDLGKSNYFANLNYVKQNRPEIKKRSVKDEQESLNNPEYIRKKVTKEEFEDWPFYVDEVEIECREKHWLVVTIDGYDYALNGASKSRYKLPDVHEYGVAKMGLSIHSVINEARKLCN